MDEAPSKRARIEGKPSDPSRMRLLAGDTLLDLDDSPNLVRELLDPATIRPLKDIPMREVPMPGFSDMVSSDSETLEVFSELTNRLGAFEKNPQLEAAQKAMQSNSVSVCTGRTIRIGTTKVDCVAMHLHDPKESEFRTLAGAIQGLGRTDPVEDASMTSAPKIGSKNLCYPSENFRWEQETSEG